MTVISPIIKFFGAIWNFFVSLFEMIVLFFEVISVVFMIIFPFESADPSFITGDNLSDWHNVGSVWREECICAVQTVGNEGVTCSFTLEFEFLEATDEYAKISIKSVDVPEILEGKNMSITFSNRFWKKVVDSDGNKYTLRKNFNFRVTEEGTTLYLYYASNPDFPAGYIRTQMESIYRREAYTFYRDKEADFVIDLIISPHE